MSTPVRFFPRIRCHHVWHEPSTPSPVRLPHRKTFGGIFVPDRTWQFLLTRALCTRSSLTSTYDILLDFPCLLLSAHNPPLPISDAATTRQAQYPHNSRTACGHFRHAVSLLTLAVWQKRWIRDPPQGGLPARYPEWIIHICESWGTNHKRDCGLAAVARMRWILDAQSTAASSSELLV